MRTILIFVLTFLFIGCSEDPKKEMMWRLAEMEAKPAATDPAVAKLLYDEASKFVSWLEAHPEDGTPEMLTKSRALRNQRALEIGEVAGGTVLDAVEEALKGFLPDGTRAPSIKKALEGALAGTEKGGLNLDLGKKVEEATDWVLGINDPRFENFACKDSTGNPVDITKEGFSKCCVR